MDDPDQPFDLDLNEGPYFLVAGTPGSGKTSLLLAWALALAERYPPESLILYVVDFRRGPLSPLAALPHVESPLAEEARGVPRYLSDDDSLSRALAEIAECLNRRAQEMEAARRAAQGPFDPRAWAANLPALWLLMDDYDLVKSDGGQSNHDLLNASLKRWRDLGFYLTVAGPISDLETDWGWVKLLRDAPVGFQLGTANLNQIFKVNLPSDNPSRTLPPGEAFYIRRSQYRRLKLADPQAAPIPAAQWVERLKKRG